MCEIFNVKRKSTYFFESTHTGYLAFNNYNIEAVLLILSISTVIGYRRHSF